MALQRAPMLRVRLPGAVPRAPRRAHAVAGGASKRGGGGGRRRSGRAAGGLGQVAEERRGLQRGRAGGV